MKVRLSHLYLIKSGFDEARDSAASMLHRLIRTSVRRRVTDRSPHSGRQRFAVLCAFEKGPREDIRAMLENLRRLEFHIIVVTPNGAHEQYAEFTDTVIHIAPVGRDFTAYKEGFLYVRDRATIGPNSSVVFLNDSVWYFERHQRSVLGLMLAGLGAQKLVAGGLIADEVPHVTGWLFASPLTAPALSNLNALFEPHFVQKSRRYHIRVGEHRILPTIRNTADLLLLAPRTHNPAIAACYEAVMNGTECFYLKWDATMRTDAPRAKLAAFIELNATESERMHAMRWIAGRAAQVEHDVFRTYEMAQYRRRHFRRAIGSSL